LLFHTLFFQEDCVLLPFLEKVGLKPKDSLHIACSILTECDYFITCDKRILKKDIKEVKTINPIDFVRSVNDYED